MPEILSQCNRADDGAVVELDPVWLARGAKLPQALQIGNRIDERRMRPWFRDTLRLRECNDVSSRFFDDDETIKLQLSE